MSGIDIRSHGAQAGKDIAHALQTAIDEAAQVTKKLHNQDKWMAVTSHVTIPSGLWLLESPVKWRNGVSISGENQSSTLIECAIPDGYFALDSTAEAEPYSMKLSNLAVKSVARHRGGFVRLKMANRSCVIDQIFCEGFDTAFDLTNCFTSVMRNCTIFDCVDGVVGRNLTNFKFYDNKIENCCHDGINLNQSDTNTSTGLALYSNVFQGNGKAGLRLFNIDQMYGAGNFFEGNNRIPFRKDKTDFSQAHIEIDSDIGSKGDKTDYSKRNGNIRFESTFFTQGYYSPPDTAFVGMRCGELISFSGGTMRAFNSVSSGFQISRSVTLPIISEFTFEMYKDNAHIGPGVGSAKIRNCLYRAGAKGSYRFEQR